LKALLKSIFLPNNNRGKHTRKKQCGFNAKMITASGFLSCLYFKIRAGFFV